MDAVVVKPKKIVPLRKWAVIVAIVVTFSALAYIAYGALGHKFNLIGWSVSGKILFTTGPKLLKIAACVGIVALLLSVAIKPFRKRHLILSLVAAGIPVIGLVHGAKVRKTARSLPSIHDISTDTQDPPIFTKAIMSQRDPENCEVEKVCSNSAQYIGKTYKYRKEVERDKNKAGKEEKQYEAVVELISVAQTKAYPDVRSLIESEDPDVMFGKALATAENQGWIIVNKDKNAGIIEATDITFWLGFKDDVIIRIRAGEGGGSVVDVRSLSRFGGSDIGKNATRIRAYMRDLKS